MMTRVSRGHAGRSVFEPPQGIGLIFCLMIAGAALHALLPLLWMDYYFLLILISQILWIGAFLLMRCIFISH